MRRYNYVQTVIGDCGHTCDVWPQVRKLGSRRSEYICDECTREQYGIDATEAVWVFGADPEPEDDEQPPKPKRASKPRKRVPVCSLCQKKGHIYTACPLMGGQTTLPLNG